jgi:uncharacterized protein (DUF1501 family)
MAGGNDGLNTVVPYADGAYYSLRQGIGVPRTAVLDLNGRIGLHPALKGFKSLWDKKQLAVIEGVGYPQPNLSHFRSMQIWHSAAPESVKYTGWLGAYLDATIAESSSQWRAVDVGASLPLSLSSSGSFVPAIDSVAAYALRTDAKYPKDHQNKLNAWAALYAEAAAQPGLAAFVGGAGKDAYKSSLDLQQFAAGYKPAATYPNTALGRALQLVAQIVTSSLGTGVAYVTTGGFDTHSAQPNEHQLLLTQLSDAVSAFNLDIEGHSRQDDVVLMTWSEFGRRPQQNGSSGTDHGTAAPMFVVGAPVKGGAYGEPPSLSSLDADGNLKFTTDFRQVYTTVLEDWLGADGTEVLGKQFSKLGFLGAAVPDPNAAKYDTTTPRGPYHAIAPGVSR